MAVLRGLNRRLLLIAGIGGAVAIFFIFKGKDATLNATETGATFLQKVMDASGGYERWGNIQHLRFQKEFELYTEEGDTEISRTELHSYAYTTGTHRLIQWENDNTLYNLVETDTSLFQITNKKIDTSVTQTQLQNTLDAATFVIGLPYTLDTPENQLGYNGVKSFEGQDAHELEVRFNGSEDVWKLYYAMGTLDWLGYWVHTSDHYSLVINEEMVQVEGFTLSQKRISYRTDAARNKTYLRAQYHYKNYAIQF